MDKKPFILVIKILVAVTFTGMITVNALANILPINGVNSGQVSDSFFNLFAPAGLTFAIWGLIYLLLLMYTVFQFRLFKLKQESIADRLLIKIGIAFIISSLANTAWIFMWHYGLMPIAMIMISIILICLIYINALLRTQKLTTLTKIFVRLPFSVYFGWLTVATIANAVTLLVYLGWDRFGIAEELWMILIVIVGMLIGSATTLFNRDPAYGLVLIWAYAGILYKHLSDSGFAGKYPEVYTVVVACLALLLIAVVSTLITSAQKKKQLSAG